MKMKMTIEQEKMMIQTAKINQRKMNVDINKK